MSSFLHCYEPHAKPMRATLALDDGQRGSVYVMQDTMTDDTRGLRQTILREATENPPAGAQLVFELEPRPARPGQTPSFLVRKIGRRMSIEVIRPDGSRGRVTRNAEVRSGSRFDVTLEDMRTVTFGLELETESKAGSRILGGGTRRSNKIDSAMTAGMWVIPSVAGVLADPKARLISVVAGAARRLGLSPAMLQPMLIMSTMMIAGIGFGAWSWYQKRDVEIELEETQAQLAATEQSRDAAQLAESACLEQRRVLTEELDDLETSLRLAAEIALAQQKARAKATELGGQRMSAEETVEYDLTSSEGLFSLLVGMMKDLREPPPADDIAACLEQEPVLGNDVPSYVLLWNPIVELVCPDDFAAVDGGVDRAGPFGLSTRAAAEFGGPFPPDHQDEPRANVRWSASAMVKGFRSITKAVLQADTGRRPPVAPGQTHAWALTIWDLYNRMPSPADGGMDSTLEACVNDLVTQASLATSNAEPGQPVLPDLAAVASGEAKLPLRPTAGCPWPVNGLGTSANAALTAIARMGLHVDAQGDGA